MTNNGNSSHTDELVIEMCMVRRRALRQELAGLEDFLIAKGRLSRRTVPTKQERKRAFVDTA